MEPLRLGVVGVGGRGVGLLKTALEIPEVNVTAVADVAKDRVDAAAALTHGAAAFTSHKELMDSGKVEAVLIGTPHPFHPPIAIDAAERGLHILSEKPLAVEVGDGDRMVQAAAKHNVKLGIMFQRRLESGHQKAREIVASGGIGEVYEVEMVSSNWFRLQAYYDSGAWRGTWKGEGGGILANQSPHDIDLMLWLGGPVSALTATIGTRIHRLEVEDTVHVVLEYGGHRAGYYKSTTSDPLGRRAIEVSGEKGRLVIEGGKLRWCKYAQPLTEHILNAPLRSRFESEWVDVEVTRDGNTTADVIRNFVHAVREGTPLVATGEDGLRALELTNAMHLSGILHERVSLPVDRARVHELYEDLRSGKRKL